MAEKDEEIIAIEIGTGNSNGIEDIKKCLDAGFDKVISVAVNKQAEGQIRESSKRQKLDKREGLFLVRMTSAS